VVSGAQGFIGSHLVRRLLDEGHSVGALVRTAKSTLDRRAVTLLSDGSTEGIFECLKAFSPDAAVHLASRYVAQHQASDIDGLIDDNLRFGCQFVDGLARCGVTRLVNIGTSFEHFHSDDYKPASLYAATKYAFHALCAYYADARGMWIVTLKLSDTYGPSDPRPKLIPLLIRCLKTGEELKLSPGGQSVNFAHVDDVVSAIQLALARAEPPPVSQMESFAVRGSEQLNLKEFVELFSEIAGSSLNVSWGARPYRDREVMVPWLGQLLPGWQPRIPLKSGLRNILADVV